MSFERAARFGDGWIASGTGPDQFREGAEKAKAAWSEAGRGDAPRLVALAYFSLGDRAIENAHASLGHYYAWLGEEIASAIADGAATAPETVRQYLATYEEAGCDELILCPSSSDPAQVDLLADAAGL